MLQLHSLPSVVVEGSIIDVPGGGVFHTQQGGGGPTVVDWACCGCPAPPCAISTSHPHNPCDQNLTIRTVDGLCDKIHLTSRGALAGLLDDTVHQSIVSGPLPLAAPCISVVPIGSANSRHRAPSQPTPWPCPRLTCIKFYSP